MTFRSLDAKIFTDFLRPILRVSEVQSVPANGLYCQVQVVVWVISPSNTQKPWSESRHCVILVGANQSTGHANHRS